MNKEIVIQAVPKNYSVAEAKSRFSEILKDVERGTPALITRGVKKEEIVIIVPIEEWRKQKKVERKLGTLKNWGEITFADDWSMSTEEFLGL